MKVKFLTKKQRQSIKQIRQNISETIQAPTINLNSHNANAKPTQPNLLIQEQQPNSDSDHNDLRSRQKRQLKVELSVDEKKQRQQLKKKYLGLEKPEVKDRLKQSYKQQLLFQWNKSDDTSNGVLNKMSFQSLKILEKKKQGKVHESLEKSWKQKTIEQMTDRDWRIFREDNQIFIKGGRVANPFRSWDENQLLHPQLKKQLWKLKFEKPKPIQMQSIPIGLEKKDMVAIAPTGEGKTLGFLIPMLHHLQNLPRINGTNSDNGPHAVVLVPSRQLAQQIEDQFMKIKYESFVGVRIVGGVQLDFQNLDIQKGCDIIFGTPGRIKQLMEKHYLSLSRCSWLVIDEADKMISENLIEDIQWIMERMSDDSPMTREQFGKSRVTHMFSATMVPQIQKLTKKYLIAPTFITIGEVGGGKKDIQQHVFIINQSQKNDELGRILRGLPGPIIVFVNTRVKCEKLVTLIQLRFKRSCQDYHGGKSQQNRQNIIQNFRNGKFQVLVATDLGGRGLDIKGISAAISYDAPKNISEFIHRAGRSGRAGVKGKAFTFLTNEDEQIFYDVKTFLQRNQFKIPQQLRQHPAAQVKPGSYAHFSKRKQIVYTN